MDEVDVDVMHGTVLVQRWPCRQIVASDGTKAVIWRGRSHPLLPGNRIDLAAPVGSPTSARYSVIAGEQISRVLVAGLATTMERVAAKLLENGQVLIRSGRWLGGGEFDWFLCCEGRLDEAEVARWLGSQGETDAALDDLRISFLEQEIAALRAERASLSQALRTAEASSDAAEAHIKAISAQLATLEAEAARPIVERPPAAAATRLQDELSVALATLRPDVTLLRDSWYVAAGEFQSRQVFWRTIGELPVSGSRPEGWKMVRGAERWWERHVSNGRDNTGRAYARFNTAGRRWDLLLGWKSTQLRDIAWLRQLET